MARSPRPEVSHADIMAKLAELEASGIQGRAAINARLDDGTVRFEQVEAAVRPLNDLIEAMGGEAQFKKLAIDAARGLVAMAWLGSKLGNFMKWATIVLAGLTALYAAIKFIFVDMWRIG